MPSALEFLVLALAVWRLTSLLVWEDGPFEMFANLRLLLGVRYDEYSKAYGTNWLAKGVVCPACASVWFGLALAVLYFFWTDCVWLALPLALSAAAIMVERWNDLS